jgi:hypothetical protein
MKKGLEVSFGGTDTCRILANGQVTVLTHKRGSLYILAESNCEVTHAYIMQGPSMTLDPDTPITALTSKTLTSSASLDTWHCRLGHLNFDSVVSKLVQKEMVNGMKIMGPTTHDKDTEVCKPCQVDGKQHWNPIPTKSDVENPSVLH